MELDYKKKSDEIIEWIKKTVSSAGFTKVIVAVSGGVDSAVSISLALRALGKENVFGLMLPYGVLSKKGVEDATMLLDNLDIPSQQRLKFDIKSSVDTLTSQLLVNQSSMINIRKGNVMARVRMIYLFDMAKKLNALVVGTENKSEYYLGYFTRFGDEASDIEPIQNLYKTQIWEMAKYLGVPEKIISKPASANLWLDQTDEREFGFSYADADRVLFHYFDEGLPREAIVALGVPSHIVSSVLDFVQKNDFKHRLPYVLK